MKNRKNAPVFNPKYAGIQKLTLVSTLILLASLFAASCTSQQSALNANTAQTRNEDYKTSAPVASNSASNMASEAGNVSSRTQSLPLSDAKEAPNGYEDKKAGNERYAPIDENPFLETSRAPLSTFSIDVDTASYSNVRRYLKEGQMPPKDAVRIEELINYFTYDYPQPAGNLPFSVNTDVAQCPWKPNHKLVLVGLQGKKVAMEDTPPSNLVFLIDVSGSMNPPDRLPLLKQGLKMLVSQLAAKDRVAIVVYAGNSGLALPSTSAANKQEILSAIDRLEAGGSTNGGSGINLAYKTALDNFIQGGNNRVILATDGDFNVGVTGDNELVSLIENKRRSGVFLSVLGFGAGNLNDSMMEKLADKGNGNYAYIDSLKEARKALGAQAAGTLFTIAKDVKIQVEFNPAKVAGYRLIGYENRLLAAKDFNDDRKDAGEIGAGHSVTALYEIVPAGQNIENPGIDELKYSKVEPSDSRFSNELMTVKLRYKEPDENESKLITQGLLDENKSFEAASENLRFASAVAGFGMLLRDSRYKGNAGFAQLMQMAETSNGSDLQGYRQEFAELIGRANNLTGRYNQRNIE